MAHCLVHATRYGFAITPMAGLSLLINVSAIGVTAARRRLWVESNPIALTPGIAKEIHVLRGINGV